jgi:hypothetical protein
LPLVQRRQRREIRLHGLQLRLLPLGGQQGVQLRLQLRQLLHEQGHLGLQVLQARTLRWRSLPSQVQLVAPDGRQNVSTGLNRIGGRLLPRTPIQQPRPDQA